MEEATIKTYDTNLSEENNGDKDQSVGVVIELEPLPSLPPSYAEACAEDSSTGHRDGHYNYSKRTDQRRSQTIDLKGSNIVSVRGQSRGRRFLKKTRCWRCKTEEYSEKDTVVTEGGVFLGIALALLCCWCCIPFVVTHFRVTTHKCSKCSAVLGQHRH